MLTDIPATTLTNMDCNKDPKIPNFSAKISETDEITKSSMIQNLELSWNEICVKIKQSKNCLNKNKKTNVKELLSNVSGSIASGNSLAIIGGSGAGKTTFLNYLSQKINSKNMICSGTLKLNGIEVFHSENQTFSENKLPFLNKNQYISGSEFETITAYVTQDDILETTMTPLETLLFTGKLKLDMSQREIEEKVASLIQLLNLTSCQNTIIGDVMKRGISGGERKRTSIAVELIKDPDIIFLDEPTTGLDSFNAYETIENICKFTKANKKIAIFTIHQPSSEVFKLLNYIFILADGKTVYYGKNLSIIDYFKTELMLTIPQNYNPFEYFIEVTNYEIMNNIHLTELQNIKAYKDIFSSVDHSNDISLQKGFSEYIQLLSDIHAKRKKIIFDEKQREYFAISVDSNDYKPMTEKVDKEFAAYEKAENRNQETLKPMLSHEDMQIIHYNLKTLIIKNKKTKEFLYELSLLMAKNIICIFRNDRILFFKIIQGLIQGIILSFLFKNMTKNFAGIQDRSGIIISSLMGSIMRTATASFLVFTSEKKVFLKERKNELYSVFTYFVAKFLCEIPTAFLSQILFCVVLYPSINLNDTYSYKYYIFTLFTFLGSISGEAYAFFIGSLTDEVQVLTNINGAFITIFLLLSGFFASSNNYAPYLKPFEYLSPFKYGYQILITLEFKDIQPLNCMNSEINPCEPLEINYTFKEEFWISCLCFILVILVFKTLAYIMIYLRLKRRY